ATGTAALPPPRARQRRGPRPARPASGSVRRRWTGGIRLRAVFPIDRRARVGSYSWSNAGTRPFEDTRDALFPLSRHEDSPSGFPPNRVGSPHRSTIVEEPIA